MADLYRYTDLTTHQVAALRGDLDALHPAMRDAFLRDGLIAEGNGRLVLTDHGAAALARAEAILAGREPEPPLIIVHGDARFRYDRKRGLGTTALKALLNLARFPGQSWKWMCSTFGTDTMRKLLRAGYIQGEAQRGTPVYLTPDGLAVLEEALQKSGARYFKQQTLEAK